MAELLLLAQQGHLGGPLVRPGVVRVEVVAPRHHGRVEELGDDGLVQLPCKVVKMKSLHI